MDVDEHLRDLRETITLLAVATLEPGRFTFELHLLALGMSGEDRAAARLVLVGLLGAAEGEQPRSWGPDAHGFLQRFGAHREGLEGIRFERAADVLADALDVHPALARTLLDAHMNDGKGLTGHQALRA